MEQIDFIYDAGVTRRFHTMPVLRHQNIADHSWHVAMLAYTLYGQDDPGITVSFLMACLTHDMAECKVGDLPAPAKRNMEHTFPDFREKWGEMEQQVQSAYAMNWESFLTHEEKRRLKLCDALDGLMFCVIERSMGNQQIVPAYKNFSNYVGQLLEDVGDVPFPDEQLTKERVTAIREWEIFTYAKAKWEAIHGNG